MHEQEQLLKHHLYAGGRVEDALVWHRRRPAQGERESLLKRIGLNVQRLHLQQEPRPAPRGAVKAVLEGCKVKSAGQMAAVMSKRVVGGLTSESPAVLSSLATSMRSRKASIDVSFAGTPEVSSGRGALTVLVAIWYERPIWVEITASRQNKLEGESGQRPVAHASVNRKLTHTQNARLISASSAGSVESAWPLRCAPISCNSAIERASDRQGRTTGRPHKHAPGQRSGPLQ